MFNPQTQFQWLKKKSEKKKVSRPINKDLFSQAKVLKMEEHFQTTTFLRNQLFILYSDSEAVNKKLSEIS